jgi:hypothetical protein
LGEFWRGRASPVWSVVFLLDNHTLLSGGADRRIRRWGSTTGEPIGTAVLAAAEDPLAADRSRAISGFAPRARPFVGSTSPHRTNADKISVNGTASGRS